MNQRRAGDDHCVIMSRAKRVEDCSKKGFAIVGTLSGINAKEQPENLKTKIVLFSFLFHPILNLYLILARPSSIFFWNFNSRDSGIVSYWTLECKDSDKVGRKD